MWERVLKWTLNVVFFLADFELCERLLFFWTFIDVHEVYVYICRLNNWVNGKCYWARKIEETATRTQN